MLRKFRQGDHLMRFKLEKIIGNVATVRMHGMVIFGMCGLKKFQK